MYFVPQGFREVLFNPADRDSDTLVNKLGLYTEAGKKWYVTHLTHGSLRLLLRARNFIYYFL
jgi:hypothetical protein